MVTRSDMTYYIWYLMSRMASYRSNRGILERKRTYLFLNFRALRTLFKCVGIKILVLKTSLRTEGNQRS